MAHENRNCSELNKVTHSVRAAQAILQYGVGAMVDFPDQTLITAAPETWGNKRHIYDERFAKALGVDYFAIPDQITYERFPEWYFCPKCKKFQPIGKWVSEYQRSKKGKSFDPYMVKHIKCIRCNQDLVVSRIVTVCERGHINDFPWVKWIHAQNGRDICGHPELSFETGHSSSEGLEGVRISCTCGATATLKGVFEKDYFEKLDERSRKGIFSCGGGFPHKHTSEKCACYPRTVQRGSSSVYFPVVYSSLVIPPYANRITTKIEKSHKFAYCEERLIEDVDERDAVLSKCFDKWVEQISQDIGESMDNVEVVLRRKWFDQNTEEVDVGSLQYRSEEYQALTGKISSDYDTLEDFSIEVMSPELFLDKLPHIKSISLINKVRVVKALIGFSRINPVEGKEDKGFVHIKESQTRWYPGYEIRGEGIFIEFEQSDIDRWIVENPLITERIKRIDNNYRQSLMGESHPRKITPKLVLLHTISHLLIKQLSFECGYSIASLAERLYCADACDGAEMAGIFIYTASGDSEGTLGGLVRQGQIDTFPRIFRRAIEGARTCSNDPVCSLSHGQGRESLNLAACHACTLLPETCCEERNGLLDRGVVIGTYENPGIGFYSKF